MSGYDVVVAGAGHNGLVCAAKLAAGGRRVLVLERRDEVGGILDVVHTVGRLRRSVIDDLDLHRRGLRLIAPPVRMLAVRPDGPPLTFWSDAERTADGLRVHSREDGDAYPAFDRHVRALAGFVGEMHRVTPPRLDRAALSDAPGALRLGRAFRGLEARQARELTRALPMAAADFVGEWFATDALRGALAARGSLFTGMGSWSAGTALVLLNDSAANDGGAAGQTVFVRGGNAALARALRAAAEQAGADVRTGAEVVRVLTEGDRVTGVELASGEQIATPALASAVDPKTVLTRWVDPVVVGPQLRWRAGNIRTPGGTARVDLALAGLPGFNGVEDEAQLQGRIVVAPGIDDVERAFDAFKYGRLSDHPLLEATIPTLADPSQADGSGHRMSVLVQWVPADTPADAVADLAVSELERVAPGFSKLVTERVTRTPADLEREFGLPDGHVYHAEHGLDQFFAWRPVLGLARHRLGVRGLYLCGSGAHPGGGITGGPGENAAREILRDLH